MTSQSNRYIPAETLHSLGHPDAGPELKFAKETPFSGVEHKAQGREMGDGIAGTETGPQLS